MLTFVGLQDRYSILDHTGIMPNTKAIKNPNDKTAANTCSRIWSCIGLPPFVGVGVQGAPSLAKTLLWGSVACQDVSGVQCGIADLVLAQTDCKVNIP